MIYDLIVAGAGASGMTAAICATDQTMQATLMISNNFFS